MTLPGPIRKLALLAVLGLALPALSAPARTRPPSYSEVSPGAYLFTPEGASPSSPLIVLFHGSGGNARQFAGLFTETAERQRAILLALQSTGTSWPARRLDRNDTDMINLQRALTRTGAAREPRQIVFVGFSDGASFALSVGLARPDLTRSIVALSPGFAFAPTTKETSQRIFIAHARRDPVLPSANVRRLVSSLQQQGYAPNVRWFNGGHRVDPDVARSGLQWALQP